MSLVLLHQKNSAGIPAGPALDRPVTSLAEHVQTAMGSFFTIQQKLILNKRVPTEFVDKFKEEKQLFKSQCEDMQQVLQSYYRHAADYATFSQRGIDDRVSSARRCLSSAKNVHRETQELCRTCQTMIASLNDRRPDLSRYLKISTNLRSQSLPAFEQLPLADRISLQTLYSAVDGVEECLRDMIAFWDHHIVSLTLVIKGQTNHPSPGEEAMATFQLWTDYQATLIQSSNTISASADALTVNPRAPPKRSYTFPTTRAERAQHQDTDENFERSEDVLQPFTYGLKDLTILIAKPLRSLGKYIRTKFVRSEKST